MFVVYGLLKNKYNCVVGWERERDDRYDGVLVEGI